ncbi:MAG: Type IV pilus assembly protein PilB, partial [Candidatus Nomurabacteria bacterium GW2011_GWD1_44_10]
MAILDTLALHGIIKKEAIPELSARLNEGASVEDVLTKAGVTKEDILKGRGFYYNLPTRDLKGKGVDFEILKYIPEDSASYYRFAPIAVVNEVLEIGITDPENIEARDALQFIATKLGMPFKIFLISNDDLKVILESYRGLTGEVTKALSELEVDIKDVDKEALLKKPTEKEGAEAKKEAHVVEDAPVAKITAVILRHATEGNASDVHIEHTGENVRVRFRVDGELFTSLVLPTNVHNSVVARIKILASLKLDEKRKPQDGRFSARIDGRKIDFRVSTFPAYYGEKVVMRILDSQKGVQKLDDIGFRPEQLALVKSALARPYGIILITGPTGSGKSTTLYSMLNELDKETKNIVSLEDPVEYNMGGISQSQVRPEIGYTFATGLRTTLRQDPD